MIIKIVHLQYSQNYIKSNHYLQIYLSSSAINHHFSIPIHNKNTYLSQNQYQYQNNQQHNLNSKQQKLQTHNQLPFLTHHHKQKMNRKSQSSLLSKTNRQFYVRRKKSPDELSDLKIGKVLKSLIKRNQTYRGAQKYSRQRQGFYTQKCQQISKTKINDKYYQLAQAKKILQINLRKCSNIFNKVLKSFEKCLSSQSIQQIQFHQLDFYQSFNQILLVQLDKQKQFQNVLGSQQKSKQIKQNVLLLENTRLEKQNNLLRKQINYGVGVGNQLNQELLPLGFGFSLGQCQAVMNGLNFNVNGNGSNINGNTGFVGKMIQNFRAGKSMGNGQQFLSNFIMTQRKLEVKNQQLQIMKREIANLKQEIFLLREQKKSLKDRINELKIKNQNLCSQIIGLQLKNKKMGGADDRREAIMCMQFQQIQSYRMEISELRKLYVNLSKKYKGLIIKFKKSTSDNNNKIGSMYNRQIQLFPQQFQAFEQIRGKIHPNNKINLNPLKQKKIQKSVLYQQIFTKKQTINNKQGIKKSYSIGSQYYYPTFYSLIAQDINFFGIDNNNFEHFNQIIKLNFIGTMRAIMDSKFNQFVYKKQNYNCSSFPAFVLAWLNTYQLSQTKRIEKLVSNSISIRETVCTFYVNLMSQKLNYCWEIITFRQFLLQTFNNDQLYFYLNLRFLLVGNDMCHDLSSTFQQIYYIDFNRCLNTICKLLKNTSQQTKKTYEQFLKRSIIHIRKRTFLDLHYILRIMLQYYQSIKQKQIDSIIKTIQMITQQCYKGKINIILADFIKIFDYHMKFLTYTHIVELYRKCYCIGNGCVGPEIIVTVLNQEGIFLRWVQTMMVNSSLKIQQGKIIDNNNQDTKSNHNSAIGKQQPQQPNKIVTAQPDTFIITPNIQWMYENQRKYRFIYNSQLTRECELLGLEQLHTNIKNQSKLNSISIFNRLQLTLQTCMLFIRKFYYSGILTNDSLNIPLTQLTNFLTNFSKESLRRNQIHLLMRDFRYKGAIGKIARFYRKKKAEMTRSILYAYSSDVMKQEQQEKNQTLRNQFMQIIQEAKLSKSKIKGKKKELVRDAKDESSKGNISEDDQQQI